MNDRRINFYDPRDRRSSNKKYRRRSFKAALPLLLFLVLVSVLSLRTKPDASEPVNTPQVQAVSTTTSTKTDASPVESSLKLSSVTLPKAGQSAIGELGTTTIHAASNEKQAPIASITKVITALVILEQHSLELGAKGDVITYQSKDEQYYHEYYAKLGAVTPVTTGETISQYDALQALLIPSSNNIADTLADYYFGSVSAYVTAANAYLRDKGLTNTTVADASGFSPDSKSTPSDLIKLGQLALQNAVIAEIVSKDKVNIRGIGEVYNANILIGEPDVVGIKPGLTDEAGYCLLFAVQLNSAADTQNTVIAATMNHQDRSEYIVVLNNLLESIRKLKE